MERQVSKFTALSLHLWLFKCFIVLYLSSSSAKARDKIVLQILERFLSLLIYMAFSYWLPYPWFMLCYSMCICLYWTKTFISYMSKLPTDKFVNTKQKMWPWLSLSLLMLVLLFLFNMTCSILNSHILSIGAKGKQFGCRFSIILYCHAV